MEYIAPPLHCILEVRWSMENGQSLRSALITYIGRSHNEFSKQLSEWLVLRDRGQPQVRRGKGSKSVYRRALLEIFDQGLNGLPILQRLQELEGELIKVSEDRIQRQLASLPFKSLIPLLGFQVPAFLILLFGPLLHQFQKGVAL